MCHIGILEKAKSWFGTVALFLSDISFITALSNNSAGRKTELEKGHSTQPKQENWDISLWEMVLKRKHHHLEKLKTDTTHFMFCVWITYVNEIFQTQESMGELTQSSSPKGLYIRAFHWHCQRPVTHMQIFSRMLLQSTQKELDSQHSLSPWSTRSLQSPSSLGCRRTAALSRRAGHKFPVETGGPQCSYCKEDIDAGTTASQSYNNSQINKIQVSGDSSRPLTLTQNCQAPA